jgi:hypothetical protein
MKRACVAALLLLIALSVWGGDFGGYLDNVTGVTRPPVGIDDPVAWIEKATLAAWMRLPVGRWTLSGQASYTYTPTIPVLADLDFLNLSGMFPATEAGASGVNVVVGRSDYADPTGMILNHTLDGIRFSTSWPLSVIRLAVGTTALVQKPVNSIILSNLDVLDLADGEKLFAPPRLIATVELTRLNAFAGQQLTLGAVIQEDFRPADELTPVGTELSDPSAGGRFDTQHLILQLSGALGPGLYHRTFYALNTGRSLAYLADSESFTGYAYKYALVLAHMAGLELTYFLPQALNSRIRVSGLFSSGDEDADAYYDGNTAGNASVFVPLTPTNFSNVFALQPGNSSHVGVSYSMRPFSGSADIMQAELSAVAYFRTAGGGPVSESSVDPASSGGYVGTDIDLSLILQPFSDLRFVLAGGVFLPNADVMSAGNENVDYQVTLQGVLRF